MFSEEASRGRLLAFQIDSLLPLTARSASAHGELSGRQPGRGVAWSGGEGVASQGTSISHVPPYFTSFAFHVIRAKI